MANSVTENNFQEKISMAQEKIDRSPRAKMKSWL